MPNKCGRCNGSGVVERAFLGGYKKCRSCDGVGYKLTLAERRKQWDRQKAEKEWEEEQKHKRPGEDRWNGDIRGI